MISDTEARLAEWILKQYCKQTVSCALCACRYECPISDFGSHMSPRQWNIPSPPPEPSKRQRIEWLRMMPDNELLKAIAYMTEDSCSHCVDRYNENCCGCAEGLVPWWQEKITLAQFRKDAELR